MSEEDLVHKLPGPQHQPVGHVPHSEAVGSVPGSISLPPQLCEDCLPVHRHFVAAPRTSARHKQTRPVLGGCLAPSFWTSGSSSVPWRNTGLPAKAWVYPQKRYSRVPSPNLPALDSGRCGLPPGAQRPGVLHQHALKRSAQSVPKRPVWRLYQRLKRCFELLHKCGDITHAFQQGLAQDRVGIPRGSRCLPGERREDSPPAVEASRRWSSSASETSRRGGTRTRR